MLNEHLQTDDAAVDRECTLDIVTSGSRNGQQRHVRRSQICLSGSARLVRYHRYAGVDVARTFW